MKELSSFQRDLLFIIAGLDEPDGQEIKAELESYYEKDLYNGRLYPNIDDLVDFGLVAKGEHDKRTNCYTVTETGLEAMDRRNRWERQYYKPRLSIVTSAGGK